MIALFGSHGLYAYDLNGKLLWKQDLGVLDSGWFYDPDYQWEHGSSPIIYRDLVIIQADVQKDSFIAAYDLKTGKLAWKTPREEISSWGTPTVYEGKTRAELITNGSKAIRGYDPATGKELWRLTPNSEVTTPTPFVAHDLIFVTSGYGSDSANLRNQARRERRHLAQGRQGIERIHCLEQERGGPYMPTPIVYGDLLYTCSNQGVLRLITRRQASEYTRSDLAVRAVRSRLRRSPRTVRFICRARTAMYSSSRLGQSTSCWQQTPLAR